jgi:hypothetical protein
MLPLYLRLFENKSNTLHVYVEPSLLTGRNESQLHYITLKGNIADGSGGNTICERLMHHLGHVAKTLTSGFFVVDVTQLNYTFGNAIWFPLSNLVSEGATIVGDGPSRDALRTLCDATLGEDEVNRLGTFTRNIDHVLSAMNVTKETLTDNKLYRRLSH